MRTAEEMYNFCKENNLGQGATKNLALKHFKIIEDSLMNDEEVIVPFIGLHNYISATKHDNNFAYALTNKRLVLGQKKLFGQNLQTIVRKNINDVSFSTRGLFSVVTVSTLAETFNVCVGGHECGRQIFNRIQEEINKE